MTQETIVYKHTMQVNILDLVDIYNGKDAQRESTGPVPFWNIGGIDGYVQTSICDKPCIAIGVAGTIGKPRILKPPYWVGGTQIYLVPKENVDIYFLMEVIETINWKYFTNPYAIPPKMSMSEFKELEIECPVLYQDMKQIGKLYQNYVREIELTKWMIDFCEELKKIIFQLQVGSSWKENNEFKNEQYSLNNS